MAGAEHDAASVAVIVVNWNGRDLLQTCLPAVFAQTYPDYEVVVVDNGSSDGSAQWLAAHYPRARLICNASNTGFAAANNQAIAATTAPYLALLNSDAAPEPGWLAALVTAVTGDESVGSCAPCIVRWNDHTIIDSQGLTIDRTGTAWEVHSGDPLDAHPGMAVREVFGASGASCLYRRTMIEQIGGLDSDFFAYLEDADLAWRARLAGWRCLYAPAAVVYHRHSATSGEGSPFKGYHLGRNKWWMIIKNYPWPALLLNLPLILGRDVLALLYHVLVRRDLSPLRGRLAALHGIGSASAKRHAVQRLIKPDGRRSVWAPH